MTIMTTMANMTIMTIMTPQIYDQKGPRCDNYGHHDNHDPTKKVP